MNGAKPSKSARKREQLALQFLGDKLIPLELSELEKIPLDEPLFEAIVRAREIKSRGALRRQRQLIGKLMREADAASIQSSLDALGGQDRLAKAIFREAESWRDRLCAEGASAATEFAQRTGHDSTNIEKLLLELNAAKSDSVKRGIRRRIFREVHRLLATERECKQK